jgi:hypothetical protein
LKIWSKNPSKAINIFQTNSGYKNMPILYGQHKLYVAYIQLYDINDILGVHGSDNLDC